MITIHVPIRTVSEANCSQHWRIKHKRRKQQQFFVSLALQKQKPPTLPVEVRIIRRGMKIMDDDNITISLKGIRDEIADWLIPNERTYINKKGKVVKMKGHSDNDPRITWQYGQEIAKQYGIIIVIKQLDQTTDPLYNIPSAERLC